MELSVQNLYGLLIRSKLMPLPVAQAMFKRWQTEAKDANLHAGKFAKWMVTNNYLTEYQAAILARGHADGFFLGEYKILERLGKGRMAGVYRAVHPLGQGVAIKVLPPSKAKDPMILGRFQRESRLAVGLKNPHVVRTFEVGEQGDLYYLVMEHLEGETLEDVLSRRGKISPQEAVCIIYQALKGLQYVHEQGMVHRDLKPANLMLLPSEKAPTPDSTLGTTVKILDIGLARMMGEDYASSIPDDPQLTTEGILLGTPDYMAPEQARNPRTVDIRADIYSLGCVLYHAIAGQPPFPDSNIISQMIRHATEPAKPLKEYNVAVQDGLQQIVDWMMAKDSAQRYPTPERAAQALEVFLAAGAEGTSKLETDPKMRSYLQWLETSSAKEGPSQEKSAQPDDMAKGMGDRRTDPEKKSARPAPAEVKRSLETDPRKPISQAPVPTEPVLVVPMAKEPTKKETLQPARGERRDKKTAPVPRPMTEKGAAASKPVAPAPAPKNPGAEETAPAMIEEFDVELVAVPHQPTAPPWVILKHLRLSRRDFIMFGIGMFTVALAVTIGKVLSILFPREKPSEKLPDDSE
jgi:eukaryotic-like serine/threonine-protein kinase